MEIQHFRWDSGKEKLCENEEGTLRGTSLKNETMLFCVTSFSEILVTENKPHIQSKHKECNVLESQ